MPDFIDFVKQSPYVTELISYGTKMAPLKLISTVLTSIGDFVIRDIKRRFGKDFFFPRKRVIKVR